MAGLVPAISIGKALCLIDWDHREKPGDDRTIKQIGRWGCRQLNIHNARLLSKVRWMPEKDSRLFGSHLTRREPGSKLISLAP